MKQKLQILLFASAVAFLSGCASSHYHQGLRYYNSYAYSLAIPQFEKAVAHKDIPDAEIKLADSYRHYNDPKNAAYWYDQVIHQPVALPSDQLNYARMLMENGNYEKAKTIFDLYLTKKSTDSTAQQLLASCDSIIALKTDSDRYSVFLLPFNTPDNNMTPAYYKNGLVFASDRSDAKKNYEWTGRHFLDVYFVNKAGDGGWGVPELLKGDMNGIFHDGPCVFSSSGNTAYFTRDNYSGKKVYESKDNTVNLKIYSVTRNDDGEWSNNITELPFCSDQFSTGHPCLTNNDQRMYFASDRPGGFGGTDIYYSDKDTSNNWGEPVNAGPIVNTPFNDMFPFIYKDTMYFSSEGHVNLGGLDIFKSVMVDGKWTAPKNMGYPINTSRDDFSFIKNDDKIGYFTSNRASSAESIDQIYGVNFNPPEIHFDLIGIVRNKETLVPIEGTYIELLNHVTNDKETAITGKDGMFYFKLDKKSDYTVTASKDCYYTQTSDVTTVGLTKSQTLKDTLVMLLPRIYIDKGIVLHNILYDFDKANIRPDAAQGLDTLIAIMKQNPNIIVELGSHTDCRGSDQYNNVLSQKRAESAVAYIVEHGIDQSRITAHGYGETQLLNKCADGVPCTEEEHQLNRRTEFKVTGFIHTVDVSCK